jgi:hypothetical protein
VRSELLGWPLALTVHALGTALVVGFMLVITLRLLGLFELIPYAALKRFFPIVWAALAVQLVSGFVLWMSRPTRYVADGAFLLKTALVVAGVLLILQIRDLIRREGTAWDAKGAISPRAFKIAAATLIVWCGVVIAGRLTGYLGAV